MYPALVCGVETRRENARIVQEKKTTFLQERIPEIQLPHGGAVFMRAVEQDHFRFVREMLLRRRNGLRIERTTLHHLHIVCQVSPLQPALGQGAEVRANIEREQSARCVHASEHEAKEQGRVT